MHILEGVTPIEKIPVKSPKDIQLFQHFTNQSKTWYAAALQDNDKLRIFKHNVRYSIQYSKVEILLNKKSKLKGHEFHQLHQRKVHAAVRLAVFTTPTTGTFIVVAENTTRSDFYEKTAVYRLALNENLEKVQNLHIDYATDISIWSDTNEIFMGIVQQYKEAESKKLSCGAQSMIYKWLGGHFDMIQHINTTCAVRLTPFTIGKSRFIAIANQGDDGTSDTFSEIFKYDLAKEKFVSYQKIATRGANDIKFFGFRSTAGPERSQDYYIVIANMYSKGMSVEKK